MAQVRKLNEQEINALETLLKDFGSQQIYEVLICLEKGIDISGYIDSSFNGSQITQIRRGLENGIDASSYADPEIGPFEMKQILASMEEAASK